MKPGPEVEQLHPREIEILSLIAEGLSNREIAQKLHLSQETVKWYNRQIFPKLGAASRIEAVSIAKKHRLLDRVQTPSPTASPLPGGQIAGTTVAEEQGRYKLGAELGRGGMGIVYQAEDTVLHRAVAVKFLSGETTEEGRRRLQREAQVAASLNHPNIVSIFDAGEMNELPYIVMELVSGRSLHEQPPAGLEQVIEIATQICAALEHAHAKGIIHRDMKPENILLTSDGLVKILDFGLAHSLTSRFSSQNLIAGSVLYLAPEQALGGAIDGRADLYALGVILYELVTGHLPFTGDDPLSVISQHLYAPLVAPSAFQAWAAPLEPVILRLMAKNPQERYDTARQVIEALQVAAQPASRMPAQDGTYPEEHSAVEIPPGARLSGPADVVTLLNQLARGRMIGRRGELNQLRELWARAQQGYGHLALISGEPGIGKTRLANELIVFTQLSKAMILRGGCYEYEATTPYLPFVAAFREWVHLQPAEAIRALMGDTASELARLAPEIESKLGPLPPNPALPAGEDRLRLFDHITRFLQNLAEGNGLLFFIDDLHWADQGTLHLLAYILRNLRSEKVLILAAYREIELDRKHPLAAALVEWNRERITTRISLERFTFNETGTLLATLFGQENVSEELTQAMYDETEGNPFFIEEVVKALIEQGQIYRENHQWERKDISELAIPQSVKEAIGRRLDHLSGSCLDVLHAAAALGKEFEFDELAAVQLMSEDQLLDALDEASTAQLLKAKNGGSFSFTHDKIREVLYEEINPIRRKRLHQRIGEALENRYQNGKQAYIQDLAHHFTESGDLTRSLKYSILAAEKARRLFALDDALGYYEIAHEAAESLDQNGQLAAIHKAIGEIHAQRGQVKLSAKAFQCAIDLETNPEARGAIKAQMGSIYTSAGDARGLAVIEEALQELNPETQAGEVALATAMIGRYYHYQCLHTKAIEYLEQALRIAGPLDQADSLMQVYAYLAGAHQHLVRFAESMAWAWKNIELGQRKNHPISAAYGYEFLAEDSMSMGRWKEALQYAAQDQEIGVNIGAQDRIAWAGYCFTFAKYHLGDLAAAEKEAQAARTLAVNIGDMRLAVLAGVVYIQVLADLGKEEQAHQLAEQVLHEADELAQAFMQAQALHGYAYALLQQNQISRALELYGRADQLLQPTENLMAPMVYRPWLAQAYFDTGRMDQAASMAESALQLARFANSRHNEALALRVQAQLHAASGDWQAAVNTIQASISILEETGTRQELGRSLFTRGRIHQMRGDLQAAATDWGQALEIFLGLGAISDTRKAREQLEAASQAAV